MLISRTNANFVSNNQRIQFKSAYPIIHWVAENNGSYAPVVSHEIAKSLNTKIIRILNTNSQVIEKKLQNLYNEIQAQGKSSSKIDREICELNLMKRVKSFINRWDKGFAKNQFARGFYNKNGGIKNGKFDSLAYLITGEDAVYFENTFGRPLGEFKKYGADSPELERAKADYFKKGYNFVLDRAKHHCFSNRDPAELHVKMEVVRNKFGAIKNYNIVDMKFFAKNGFDNPFLLLDFT
ncbi:hypothetical protein J6R97_04725 [bacterium]|nr:hypothetical protein [bacterium]